MTAQFVLGFVSGVLLIVVVQAILTSVFFTRLSKALRVLEGKE